MPFYLYVSAGVQPQAKNHKDRSGRWQTPALKVITKINESSLAEPFGGTQDQNATVDLQPETLIMRLPNI